MQQQPIGAVEALSDLAQFDAIIDVRSPGEFADDHLPRAINCPVLDDAQRVEVGTLHKQVGAFEARRRGAALVARNIALHLQSDFSRKPRHWRPLVYCWRGGMRSNSVADVLETLGYPAWRLAGGYKAFRRLVVRYLANYSFRVPVFVLNGLTGVGKTMIIRELIRLGVPALDLEAMAGHRGSVFGGVGLGAPHSQKDFEALLFLELRRYQGSSYLVVEGEGKRIGPIVLPDFLFAAMKQGPHILLEAILDVRVARILAEYQATSTEQAEELAAAVLSLRGRLGDEKCADLAEKICSGRYAEAAIALCRDYYDCFYKDSRRATGQYLSVVDVDDLDQGVQRIMMILAKYRHSS